MIKMHLYKAIMVVALITTKALAQGAYQKKDTAFSVTAFPYYGKWVLIIMILAALLLFSYLLTRAIEKRKNQ